MFSFRPFFSADPFHHHHHHEFSSQPSCPCPSELSPVYPPPSPSAISPSSLNNAPPNPAYPPPPPSPKQPTTYKTSSTPPRSNTSCCCHTSPSPSAGYHCPRTGRRTNSRRRAPRWTSSRRCRQRKSRRISILLWRIRRFGGFCRML